jgi:hypothetical protein
VREDWFRLVLIQGSTAFAAEIIDGSELDEMTMVASHHFPVFDGCESRSHLGFGSARAGHCFPMDHFLPPDPLKLSVLCGMRLIQSRGEMDETRKSCANSVRAADAIR